MIWMCVINRRFKDVCVHNRVDYIAINKAQRLGEEKIWGHKKSGFYFGHMEVEMPVCIPMLIPYKLGMYGVPILVI